MSVASTGTLFVVATPIGNLNDLTPRAAETLGQVNLIAAEDTRHTGRLLTHIGCKTRLLALHDHNEDQAVNGIIEQLLDGQSVAIVSDAGTPLLSDPGFRLVRAAHANAIKVSPIPGASAVTAALSVAGIATDRFCFEGFLPSKSMARRESLAAMLHEPRTLVFFESVHRIEDCLRDMLSVFGTHRQAFIGRELSKLHEDCLQDSLASIVAKVEDGSLVRKGEFVIVVAGASTSNEEPVEVQKLLALLADKLPTKEVAATVAEAFGLKKNELYERLLRMRK